MKPAGRLEPQPWMTADATRAVMGALSADGSTPRFVGGCVRDALLDRAVKDVDIATPDAPETVIRKLSLADLKSVPTGLKHGTVTAIASGYPYEVTTLRQDVETDGRHAEVAFTDDWVEDAMRRDLTINAIYCDADGTLYDPVGGLADVRAGQVRFVGEAAERIAEDVLRILRFFRFFAHYGQGDIDTEGYAACRKQAHLLHGLSAERVSAELLRTLAADDPAPTFRLMWDAGVLARVLSGAIHLDHLNRLIDIEKLVDQPDPLRRLFALRLPEETEVATLAGHLRLSKTQKQRLSGMARRPDDLTPEIKDKGLRRILYVTAVQTVLDQAFVKQMLDEASSSGSAADWNGLRARVQDWQPRPLPVQGQDVLDLGIPAGPDVGVIVRQLEQWWIECDFRPDRTACLDKLKTLIPGS